MSDQPNPPVPPSPSAPSGNTREQVRNWLLFGLVVIAALVYIAYTRRHQGQAANLASGQTLITAPAVNGVAAPEWVLTTPDGKRVDFHAFAGHPVVVDFWASWCGPCKEEEPTWKKLQDKYRAQGLVIIGVSEDDSDADLKNFLAQDPVNYTIVVDHQQLAGSYGIPYGLPTTFFIDRQGRVSARVLGLEDAAQLEARVQKLM